MQQTLPAREIQNLVLADIIGAVTIQGWDQQSFELTAEQETTGLRERGDTLALHDVRGNVALRVPFETRVNVRDIRGSVSIEATRQANVTDVHGEVTVSDINGDVVIKDIGQGRVTVRAARGLVHMNDIGHSILIDGAQQVSLNDVSNNIEMRNISGNTTLHDVSGSITLSEAQGSVSINDVSGEVSLNTIGGNVQINDISSKVTLIKVEGHVTIGDISSHLILQEIGGEVAIHDVAGHLEANGAATVRVSDKIGSDGVLTNVEHVEITRVGGSLLLKDVQTASLRDIGNNLQVEHGIATLSCRRLAHNCEIQGGGKADILLEQVGADAIVSGATRLHINRVGHHCRIQDSAYADIAIGAIGHDLSIPGAARVVIGSVGNRCELRDIQGDVQVGHVGSTAEFSGVGGKLLAGAIGTSAQITGLHGPVNIGSVGNNLLLQADFPPGSSSRARVGGSATIVLPDQANLSIRATSGGSITGRSIATSPGNSVARLVYGEGAAHLDVSVGGHLEIKSNEDPHSSSNTAAYSNSFAFASPGNLGRNWADFGREMAELSAEMSKLGADLGHDITEAVKESTSWLGADLSRAAEERARRFAQEQARRAERIRYEAERRYQRFEQEQARRAEHNARLNIRINEREWRMDQHRLERILEQARRASTEGIAGALDAVEQALRNLSMTPPPPPAPPSPPPPATAPLGDQITPQTTPQEEQEQAQSVNGPSDQQPEPAPGKATMETAQSMPAEPPAPPAASIEQEREAILRMIAEGRITPDEGDMLLEALS